MQAEVVKQEMRLRAEKENLEKEKRMLMGTASGQDNQVRVYIVMSFLSAAGAKAYLYSGACISRLSGSLY